MSLIPRERVLDTLRARMGSAAAGEGVARSFADALREAGLADKRAYSVDEVEAIASAMATLAMRHFETGLEALRRLEAEGPG